jgi:mRNA interferase MazF
VKRGEIWTMAGGSGYAGKPRPSLIIQDDSFTDSFSVTVCPITGSELDAYFFRVKLDPTAGNGLLKESRVMIDKIVTVPRTKLGDRIGKIEEAAMAETDRAITIYLGLVGR